MLNIVEENLLPGTPRTEWDVEQRGSTSIEGFATDISVNHGETIDFKINSAGAYDIEIYRLGYYGGDGARLITRIDNVAALSQPDPLRVAETGMVDAGNWSVTASWDVPSDMTSGVFIAKLIRHDGSGDSQIPFIIRADESSSDIVFQTSDTTWQAYNTWGSTDADGTGASLYLGDAPPDRAYAVSYNRPFVTRDDGVLGPNPWNYILGPEYSAIYWLEKNGYDVSYISGVDTDRFGANLLNHEVYLSVGHDEYWSGQQRANVEAARDAGVNLAFWTANEVYWRVRWESSVDASGTPYRTLVCYKESFVGDIDPSNEWTGTFRDGRFTSATAVGGGMPENALVGSLFGAGYSASGSSESTIRVPYETSQFRFWRDTDVANLQPGQNLALSANLLTYEWDVSPDNVFRPAGLIKLSATTVNITAPEIINDYGTATSSGVATHNLTLYRDQESGALVFGAGTVFWSFGLSGDMDVGSGAVADRNIQQAMVNLLADMGVQPQTLQSGLVYATASNDVTAPKATVAIEGGITSVQVGQTIRITGTATDDDGNPITQDGKVAAIEVSTNDGATWKVANGTTNWFYDWAAVDPGDHMIRVRAIDDSVNLQVTNQAAVNLKVTLVASAVGEFIGTAGSDVLTGTDRQDFIYGLDGADTLLGQGGNDFLYGDLGRDRLTGGAGSDRFDFDSIAEAGTGAYTRDIVTDFLRGSDKFDLSTMDANQNVAGNQAFIFSTTWGAAYSVWASKYDYAGTANDKTIVFGDTTGDRKVDFQIEVSGLLTLNKTDFIL